MKINIYSYLTIILIATLAMGCQSKLLTVYKIDVQQGNALEASKVDKINVGMTKDQVHYLLGTPIIADSFHPDRWDYIYLFRPGYGEQERRQFTVFFDRGEVIEIYRDNITSDNLSTAEFQKLKKEKSESSEDDENNKDEGQIEAEEQAEQLKEALEENKDPI